MIVVLAACAAVLASSVRCGHGPRHLVQPDGGTADLAQRPSPPRLVASLTARANVGRSGVARTSRDLRSARAGGWALALLTGVVGYTPRSRCLLRARGRAAPPSEAVAIVVLVAFVTSGSNTELRAQTFAVRPVRADAGAPARRRPRTLSARLSRAAAARRLGERARVGPARRRPRRALRGDLGSPIGAQRQRAPAKLAAAGGRVGPRARGPACSPRRTGSRFPATTGASSETPRSGAPRANGRRSTLGNQPVFFVLLAVAVVVVARGGSARLSAPVPSRRCSPRRPSWACSRFATSSGSRSRSRPMLPQLLDSRLAGRGAPRSRNFNLRRGGRRPGVRPRRQPAWVAVQRPIPGRADVPAAPRSCRECEPRAPTPTPGSSPTSSRRTGCSTRIRHLRAESPMTSDTNCSPENELDRIVAFRLERGPHWQSRSRARSGYSFSTPAATPGAVKWFERRPNTQVVSRAQSAAWS